MHDSESVLDDLAFLRAFLDVVIPPGSDGRMPGAGSVGLAPDVAESVRADPMLGPLVLAGLTAVAAVARERGPAGLAGMTPAARVELVQSQMPAHPALMMGMSVHTFRPYYQHPAVLTALGEPGRAPFPEGFLVQPTDPGLMERLRSRARAKPAVGER
jgi:hypothetical protein